MNDKDLKAAIKTVKSGVLIEDIAGRYIKLEKSGVYLKGKCPLQPHKEKTFTITPHKQIFYCFDCHEGGDSITLICKIMSYSPIQAVDYIKEEYLDKENSCASMADEE